MENAQRLPMGLTTEERTGFLDAARRGGLNLGEGDRTRFLAAVENCLFRLESFAHFEAARVQSGERFPVPESLDLAAQLRFLQAQSGYHDGAACAASVFDPSEPARQFPRGAPIKRALESFLAKQLAMLWESFAPTRVHGLPHGRQRRATHTEGGPFLRFVEAMVGTARHRIPAIANPDSETVRRALGSLRDEL